MKVVTPPPPPPPIASPHLGRFTFSSALELQRMGGASKSGAWGGRWRSGRQTSIAIRCLLRSLFLPGSHLPHLVLQKVRSVEWKPGRPLPGDPPAPASSSSSSSTPSPSSSFISRPDGDVTEVAAKVMERARTRTRLFDLFVSLPSVILRQGRACVSRCAGLAGCSRLKSPGEGLGRSLRLVRRLRSRRGAGGAGSRQLDLDGAEARLSFSADE
eukprot:767316-Hanusia_phi.AAC.2